MSVGDISHRQANPREISDMFHFTAIHFLPERHSAMVLICIYMCRLVGMSVVSKMRRQNYVAHTHAQSNIWAVKTDL